METSSDNPSPTPDDFDRRLWEVASGNAGDAAFKEPSAAERASRAERAASAERMSWRSARKAARLRKPVPEASRPRVAARRKLPPTTRARSARHQARSVLIVVIALAVLAGVGYVLSALGKRVPSRDDGASGTSGLGGPAFTASDPFADTPAERFTAGSAGIALPPGRTVGAFSAAQVSAAYLTTKRLLVAADLDPQTLSGGRPGSFAQLLAPQLRSYFLNGLDQMGVDKHGYSRSTRSWIASFAPGTTSLVGSVIKVHGKMEATTAADSGRRVLRISFDYLFVYPVERPGQPSTRMRVVMRQQGDVDFARWNDSGGSLQAWFLPGSESGPYGSRCDVRDGFIHPEFPDGPPDRVHPSGAPVDPYNQTNLASRAACLPTTGI